MKPLLPVALSFCAITSGFADAPFLDLKFDDALKKAAQENKIVLIDVCTTWCPPCRELERVTWPDADVQKLLNEKTVPLMINADNNEQLADKYNVVTYPCVLLLKPDGTEIDRLIGFRPPKDFISDFNLSMSGRTTEVLAREAVAKAGGKDPELRLNLADLLRQKGSNAEALDEFLWCYNHGLENDPNFAWDRKSWLLNSLEILSETYPPAQKARASLRDDKEKAMLAGTGDRQTADDLVSLNEDQGHPQKSLDIFDQLPDKSRAIMAIEIADKLAEAKRYKDLLDTLGNSTPEDIFTKEADQSKLQLTALAGNPEKKDEVKYLTERPLSIGAGFFEALAGSDKDVAAINLARKILEFSNADQTRNQLIKCAVHAGNADVVDFLKDQSN